MKAEYLNGIGYHSLYLIRLILWVDNNMKHGSKQEGLIKVDMQTAADKAAASHPF